MKTNQLWNKSLRLGILAGTLLIAASSQARAEDIPTRSFQGHTRGGEQVNLLLAGPIPGRDESYLGFLLHDKGGIRAEIFMVDPDSQIDYVDDNPDEENPARRKGHVTFGSDISRYTLTPWKVLRDGELGETNINATNFIVMQEPTPFANIFAACADKHYHERAFKITSANAGNFEGPAEGITFDGRCSSEAIIGYTPGNYAQEGVSRQGISFVPDSHGETTVALAGEAGLNGTYLMREKQLGLFNLRSLEGKGTGTEIAQFPSRIGFFLRKSNWFCSRDKFVLVDPTGRAPTAVFQRDLIQPKIR